METEKLIGSLLLGGVLGFLGQGIRLLAGLKKLTASADGGQPTAFDTRRMLVSLLLGFIAGALGILTFIDKTGDVPLDQKLILTLIGIGYSGVDFIEALLTKYVDQVLPNNANRQANGNQQGANVPTHIIRRAQLPYSSK